MMVQDYGSGLMTPMMPVVKASQLNATVVCCEPPPASGLVPCLTCTVMLLNYILLIVVPLFFMLGACACNDPVYPSYVFSKANSSPLQALFTYQSQISLVPFTRLKRPTREISTAPLLSSGLRVWHTLGSRFAKFAVTRRAT